MITQENQTGKKPEENLTYLFSMLKANPLQRIEVYKTQTTNILLLPHVELTDTTTCKLGIHGLLLYQAFATQAPTLVTKNTNSPICDSKTTLEG